MDEAFATELGRRARERIDESKRSWTPRGGAPHTHTYRPDVTVTAVEVTITDRVGTVHVLFLDDHHLGERFGARSLVQPHLEDEGSPAVMVEAIAELVLQALGELTWAGGPPLSRPVGGDGARWYDGDVI